MVTEAFGRAAESLSECSTVLLRAWKRLKSRHCRPPFTARRTSVVRKQLESLESRNLLAAMPFGATAPDTGEYMLGDIYVTVVLMESDPTLSPNNVSTENWTPALIQDTKTKIDTGLHWWQDTLKNEFPNNTMPLNFDVDFTNADTPVHTGYEPIDNISNMFQNWMYDFLNQVGYNQTHDFQQDIRAFNNHQRVTHNTDWAFTIFVVNSTNTSTDSFAPGGQFSRAFSYAGGEFMVVPSGRPASTYAHETGHQFWAKDEYAGGASYNDQRGYYNAQNSNAIDGAPPGFVQQDSIMSTGTPLTNSYNNHTLDAATMAMIGWKDSDGDGIFDAVDVPNTLSGSGYYDAASGAYKFKGTSAVQTLPNKNSAGTQDDITINVIDQAQYRIDGGAWQTAATYSGYSVNLNLSFAVPAGSHTVEIRTFDSNTGDSSSIFQGTTDHATEVTQPGINGFVYNDSNNNSSLDQSDKGLAGWTVQVVDSNSQPVTLQKSAEPDANASGTNVNTVYPGVTLTATGAYSDPTVLVGSSGRASTGTRVFQYLQGQNAVSTWGQNSDSLKMQFATPISTLSIDAIGESNGAYGRLEIYDSNNTLLARYDTASLAAGAKETMTLTRSNADIAYAIASGRGTYSVELDNLTFGPKTTAVTDANGAFSLPAMPAGSFTIMATPPTGWISYGGTAPKPMVTLASTSTVGTANLGEHGEDRPWQNQTNVDDVNHDSFVSPIDALVIINYLNTNSTQTLPALHGAIPSGYIDVNGDGVVAPIDALLVINKLNAISSGEGPASPVSADLATASAASTASSAPQPTNSHMMVITKTGVETLQSSEGEGSGNNVPNVITQGWSEFEAILKSIAPTIAKAYLRTDTLGDTHVHPPGCTCGCC